MRGVLLALIGALCFHALPASAATAAQRAGAMGPNLYSCAVQNAGVKPSLCADFQHGIYILNGVRYSSFVAMGGTVPAGCVINGGTGASCSGSANISMPAQNPANNYLLVTNAAMPTGGTFVAASVYTDASHRVSDFESTNNRTCGTSSASGTGVAGSDGIVALYVSGSALSCSLFGAAPGGISGAVPSANGSLVVANLTGNSLPVALPRYVRSVRLYAGTFTNAQVSAAATH